MKRLINYLRNPQLNDLDVDSIDRLDLHRRLLMQKRMLRDVFYEFHENFKRLSAKYFSSDGVEIELGSGVSPMRDLFPDVLATDIVYSSSMDMVLNAEKMDLKDESVKVFYGQNCFHHFSKPESFFQEINRVLTPGGGLIILEPYYGPVASFVFKRLFSSEGFDKKFKSWETPATGPMNGANQALSYIVFVRDRKEFELKFPDLKIVHHEICGNYLKYMLSGGLNFRQLIPDRMAGLVTAIEKLLNPLNHVLGLHHIIVIRKS
jgi:SAM-dependent methyltransferase